MKEKLLQGWNYLRGTIGLPAMIVILLFGSYFFYATIRDRWTRLELERQAARIDQYSKQSQEAIEQTNAHLASFEKNHETTLVLLDTINEMSSNIKQLADNDRVITVRVDSLKNEYETARNQKRSTAVKSSVPVRTREDRVLSADLELYPEQ